MSEYHIIMGPDWNCPECHRNQCSDWQARNVFEYKCRECGADLETVPDDD